MTSQDNYDCFGTLHWKRGPLTFGVLPTARANAVTFYHEDNYYVLGGEVNGQHNDNEMFMLDMRMYYYMALVLILQETMFWKQLVITGTAPPLCVSRDRSFHYPKTQCVY